MQTHCTGFSSVVLYSSIYVVKFVKCKIRLHANSLRVCEAQMQDLPARSSSLPDRLTLLSTNMLLYSVKGILPILE